MENPSGAPNPNRRQFFKAASAAVLSGLAAAAPIAAGLPVLLDPLRRKAELGGPVRVTTLEALPADGIPRKFSIISSRVDAWNRYADEPIGAVYLRRTGPTEIEALNVVCPHAGCFVDFVPARKGFFCPCHNSTFGLDGKIADAKSPAPRPMDSLPVEVRNGSEVWVAFQNFRAGHAGKVPVA